MSLRQAAQQALEILNRVMSHGQAVAEAKEVLRAALAEPDINAELVDALRWIDRVNAMESEYKEKARAALARAGA